MKEAHERWIRDYVASVGGFTRGKCGAAVKAMLLEFPELRAARGFVDVAWGRDQHHWCVAPDGEIVDPTVSQFDPLGVFAYEEIDPSKPEDRAKIPTGKCMDCGGWTFGGATFCSDECERSTMEYMRTGRL